MRRPLAAMAGRPTAPGMGRVMASVALVAALVAVAGAGAAGFGEVFPRSVSTSRQFVIYCEDTQARLRVGSFAEETKAFVLGFLGMRDEWAAPVVITMGRPPTAAPEVPPAELRLLAGEGGVKIELNVALGENMAAAQFPAKLVRAILLEIAYRGRQRVVGGAAYREVPDWLVEGLTALSPGQDARRELVAVSRGVLAANRLPTLAEFLALRTDGLDSASAALYRAWAASLVRLLSELPNGRDSLVALVRGIPDRGDDEVGELAKRFAALADSASTREKWWALGVARLAAADRFKGLSVEETTGRLDALLRWDVPGADNGPSRRVGLDEYRVLAKETAVRPALEAAAGELLALQAVAHPLLRPAIEELHRIVAQLARGQTRGIGGRLAAVAEYREGLGRRLGEIADYLNWFEATQPAAKSGAFSGYLRAAREKPPVAAGSGGPQDPIKRYLDGLEPVFDRRAE